MLRERNAEKPFVNHLKVFGCAAYARKPSNERRKLESKTARNILLGYGTGIDCSIQTGLVCSIAEMSCLISSNWEIRSQFFKWWASRDSG